jgi:GTP-binding protein
MKFVDEATIRVEAGKGGDGCLSFRREKYVPRGGPDGGDGGDGGSVYLVVDTGLNTLVDFRHARLFQAENGEAGQGQQCSGRKGRDLGVRVPLGTLVYDDDTYELIGDLNAAGARLLVAKGGAHGLGNTRFKSSINRTPRKTTPGAPGEKRNLRLELQVLADVGLVGLPNAGKSSLIRQVTRARPKVADYPFTTLYPHLGVVHPGDGENFVMADIPGLIAGAASGAGLGTDFLKHLSRTRLLLHMVDIGTCERDAELAEQVRAIETELRNHDEALFQRERWLVLNKIDLLNDVKKIRRRNGLIRALQWQRPVYLISAATGAGCRDLVQAIQAWLSQRNQSRLECGT